MLTCIVAPAKPTLTVGTLRDLMADLPDDTQVTVDLQGIEGSTIQWANIRVVDIPDFEEQFFLNLNIEDTFDPRQL